MKRVLSTAAVVIGAAILLALGLRWLEPHLIYFPSGPVQQTPADAGLEFRDVEIGTEDGVVLRAWWVPAAPDAPVLLFFHGNAGSREHRLHNLAGLYAAGLAVLIFDYRGYGGSSGRPSESGLHEDGMAALAWVEREINPRRTIFFGRSLGAAVAAGVAASLPPDRRPAGLILEAPFTSARDMASRVMPLPGIGYLAKSNYDVVSAVQRLALPLLVVHGDADETVPFSMGRAVFEASASARKTFRAIPGGRHGDAYYRAGEDYWEWIRGFAAGLPDGR